MKKLLTILILLNLFTNNITALETKTVTIVHNVEPSYSVLIPKKLDVTRETTTLDFKVKGDIYADQLLKVIFEDETTITNGRKDLLLTINQEESGFDYQELANGYISSSIEITHASLSSGKWSGQLNVYIYLEDQ